MNDMSWGTDVPPGINIPPGTDVPPGINIPPEIPTPQETNISQEAEKTFALAKEIGALLSDHKGGNVVVMDMRDLNFWTDFFVIATVSSSAHLSGLERHIRDFSRERGLDMRRSRRPESKGSLAEDEWCLVDLGNIIVHLMNEKSRSFYELERLWSSAPIHTMTDKGQ